MFYFSIDPGFVKTLGPLAAPVPEVSMDHLQAPDPALTWDSPGMSCRGILLCFGIPGGCWDLSGWVCLLFFLWEEEGD